LRGARPCIHLTFRFKFTEMENFGISASRTNGQHAVERAAADALNSRSFRERLPAWEPSKPCCVYSAICTMVAGVVPAAGVALALASGARSLHLICCRERRHPGLGLLAASLFGLAAVLLAITRSVPVPFFLWTSSWPPCCSKGTSSAAFALPPAWACTPPYTGAWFVAGAARAWFALRLPSPPCYPEFFT